MSLPLFFYFIPGSAVVALGFAGWLIRQVLAHPPGTKKMQEIARAVQEGATAYLKRQYQGVGIFFLAVFLILFVMAINHLLSIFIPFAFLVGGGFSALAGFIGMTVATRAGARTAQAARHGLNPALRVAFSSGMVSGLVVVGLALLFLSLSYLLLHHFYLGNLRSITSTLLSFGMGASSQALFARVGGGIYTKAADVGADLVGKVEAGIPEDDPRNPAVIADNVGDNVGDIAGMGADLFESYVGAMVATMSLAVAAGLRVEGVLFPMFLAGIGVVASILGSLLIRTGEEASQRSLLSALRRGTYSTSLLVALAALLGVYLILGADRLGIYWAILAGLLTGVVLGFSTEYFTSDHYRPTLSIARSAQTSPATVIIEGLSAGMLSTVPAVVLIGGCVLGSFYLAGGSSSFDLGLYGIGIAAVGMLSTLGITLASDAYGPVADNAGGNAQMSGQPPEVRERTDALDALGNTTAATGKGFAIGSAALTALVLIVAYRNQVQLLGRELSLSLVNPRVVIGLFLGAMLPFGFCALIMSAIGRTASKIVEEVRRQFRELKGLWEGTESPDYARAVDLCTRAAQHEMIAPSLLAIIAPLLVGILLGVEAVVALLTGALVSGFALAILMANSGGAWDNAKKYIEKGNFGGKGSEAHKAGVVGDTVGDPLKDAAGPSLNILIKLMSMVSIVFLSLVLKLTLFK